MRDAACLATHAPFWRFERLSRPGGAWLRLGHGPAPAGPARGSVLLLPGRCEAIEKYEELAQALAARGYRTVALDWRGQGGSARMAANRLCGHVDRFETFLDDLEAALPALLADMPQPVIALGHSMGGHLLLRFAADRTAERAAQGGPGRVPPFAGLIACAPMLGVRLPMPEGLALRIATAMVGRGLGERYAWGQRDWGPHDTVFAGNRLTGDPVRFQTQVRLFTEHPDLALGGASWGWLAAALASIRHLLAPSLLETMDLPVLLLSGVNDGIVRLDRHAAAARRLPHCTHRRYAGARHELLMETDAIRDRVLADIMEFLDRLAPVQAEHKNGTEQT
ncbi:alpha/beta fold hydrolase [Oleisolibacter albus]|uniref:alpha/beta fold hydrolase n=1 Tax=Oleisolibacter albus TaxID=2171757 RepID=UPI00138F9F0B|nr:alpha/beta hydrolase [Oleisolibacter albus]